MTQQLSPAAKAVLDASVSVFWRPVIDVPALHHKSVAAALRAAADQVLAAHRKGQIRHFPVTSVISHSEGVNCACDEFRLIAAELESQ